MLKISLRPTDESSQKGKIVYAHLISKVIDTKKLFEFRDSVEIVTIIIDTMMINKQLRCGVLINRVTRQKHLAECMGYCVDNVSTITTLF